MAWYLLSYKAYYRYMIVLNLSENRIGTACCKECANEVTSHPSPIWLLTELDVSRGLLHRTGDISIEQSTPSGWLLHGLCREGDKHSDMFPFSSKNSFLLSDEELRFSWDWSANSSVLKYSPRNEGGAVVSNKNGRKTSTVEAYSAEVKKFNSIYQYSKKLKLGTCSKWTFVTIEQIHRLP